MRISRIAHPGPLGLAAVFAVGVACAAAGEPGSGTPAASAVAAAATAPAGTAVHGGPRHTDADVRFMQDMIVHHAQALVMTALVPDRSDNAQIRTLSRRIELSQRDEIAMMASWLERRGEPVPHVDADHHRHHGHDGGHAAMPGMLTHEELSRLERASGAGFDRLFLELMIHHHEGALIMVAELVATDGAAQDLEVFKFASHVEADQHAEIMRMRSLLNALLPRG